VTGTPTIYVNGKKLGDNNASTLFNAIAAADKGHTPVPSVTPKPSASKSASGSGAPSASSTVSPSGPASTTPKPSPSATASK